MHLQCHGRSGRARRGVAGNARLVVFRGVREAAHEGKMLAIDLFCGLGGWADGLLAKGWTVIGFDIERHDYGTGGYPGQLVLQDVRTIDGAQFRNADLIVASPP